LLAGHVARALAQYAPASLVSYSGSIEANDAYSPAIAAGGEYVAFVGSFNGVHGVYRKDLATGELVLVAGEDSADPALSAPDAGSPSISAEGRYVSFTTSARLNPSEDQNGDPGHCSSVYVRDMDLPATQEGAYILISALNGTTQGIAYAGSATAGCPGGGSASADRVAISASGEEVAFTVLGSSDLSGGVGGPVTTPPDQVAVRNWVTDTTTLVSQTIGSLGGTAKAVPGGAALAPLGDRLQAGDGRQFSGSTAAISADGSTVAWMGVDIAAQAPANSAEDSSAKYDEPLWRKISDGPDAPIRRVTGGDDPQCGCQGPLDTTFDPNATGTGAGPERGVYLAPNGFGGDPLNGGSSLDSVTPQLSENGQVVAFLSSAPRTGQVTRGLEEELATSTANAYVVNMADGLTRTQALTQLTAWGSDDFKAAAGTGAIQSIALSPSGQQVAFTTSRIDFPLTPPALLTPSLSQAGSPQLYVANLSADSLEMVSYGFNGEPANGALATPSFAGSGETLAFASSASNLVFGAYDEGAEGEPGNVFTISQLASPQRPAQSYVTGSPAQPVAPTRWELLLHAASAANGSIEVSATVPGAGDLKATAKADVPVRPAGKDTRVRRTRTSTLAERKVASAGATPGQAGLVHLRLSLSRAQRKLAQSPRGLYATIALTFTARGQATLTGTLQASFHKATTKRARKAQKKR
jgi:hypothetical protein